MALNDAPYFNTTHMVYNPGTHLAAYFPEHFTEPTVPASIQVHPTASLHSNNYYNETPQYFTEVSHNRTHNCFCLEQEFKCIHTTLTLTQDIL